MKMFLKIFLSISAIAFLLAGEVVTGLAFGLMAMTVEMGMMNVLACTLTPITKSICTKCRAGVSQMWVADCSAVDDLVFDADRCVVGITMDATHPDPTFKLIEFEKGTAFLNQEKTVNKNSCNVKQTINMVFPCMNYEIRNALQDLNGCCCLHAIVKDNGGNYHYLGITYNQEIDEWNSEDLGGGEGSGNTGTDPVSDSNEYIETLTTNSAGWYAPYFKGGEAGIPV